MEEWKVITFNDGYEVSNMGRIRNRKTKKLLKPRAPRLCHWQLTCFLYYGRFHFQYTISQIVFNHFCLGEGEEPTYYYKHQYRVKNNRIGHRDGDIYNNKAENLYRY